ncbi:hypothetical protein CKO23_19715 [Thiocystis violacea]|nr:hypothetical protein [Thiocystis violacea]
MYPPTALDDPLTQLLRHPLTIAFILAKLLGDLKVRLVQPHQVQRGNHTDSGGWRPMKIVAVRSSKHFARFRQV